MIKQLHSQDEITLFFQDLIGECYELEKKEELRIEVIEEYVLIELVNGVAIKAEAEMVTGIKYRVKRWSKFSIFTYHGCSIMVYGQHYGSVSPF